MHRARVFLLTADNEWSDVATGLLQPFVSGDVLELVITCDEPGGDDEELSCSTSNTAPSYTLTLAKSTEIGVQQDTVLAWTRQEDNMDVAVSFETQAGCEAIWAVICKFQGRLYNGVASMTSLDDDGVNEEIELPDIVNADNIAGICELLERLYTQPFTKRIVGNLVCELNYLDKLVDLFTQSPSSVKDVYTALKWIVLLNSTQVIKQILEEPRVYVIARIFELERDSELTVARSECIGNCTQQEESSYTDHLRGKFNQVVPIKSQDLVNVIQETFKAQYFKDVVLARILDDETFSTMVMLIRSNHVEIVQGLEEEGEIYSLIDDICTAQQRRQVLCFFKEFLSIAKVSTSPQQLRFYQHEYLSKFVDFLKTGLVTSYNDNDSIQESLPTITMELLQIIAQHDCPALRSVIAGACKRNGQDNILSILIDCFITRSESRWPLAQLFKTLLDAAPGNTLLLSPVDTNAIKVDEMLNVFYPSLASKLLNPFLIVKPSGDADLLFHLCELLLFFIQTHKFRIKYLLLRSLIIQNVVCILSVDGCPGVLLLAALRVFKTMLATQDDFYHRFFVKNMSFRHVVFLFKKHQGKNNLVESALFDFFELIRQSQSKLLIDHLIDVHSRDLQSLENNVYDRLHTVYRRLRDDASMSECDVASTCTVGDDLTRQQEQELVDLSDTNCNVNDPEEDRPDSPIKRYKGMDILNGSAGSNGESI